MRLGTVGFGGPIALAGQMQRDLVEERHWVSRQDYLEGLAFSQLSPGPLAAQLAMYLGWVRACAIGATLIGILFILPSFLMVVALAAIYVHFGSLPWIQGIFYGIGAAVIAIIARSVIELVKGTIGKDWLLWSIFAALAITTAWTESEIVWLFVICGAIAMLVKAPPRMSARAGSMVSVGGLGPLLTGIHGLVPIATLGVLHLFFLKAGAFVFGSGLAIMPFLYGGVVGKFHWLTERQFVDAIAVAMITPLACWSMEIFEELQRLSHSEALRIEAHSSDLAGGSLFEPVRPDDSTPDTEAGTDGSSGRAPEHAGGSCRQRSQARRHA